MPERRRRFLATDTTARIPGTRTALALAALGAAVGGGPLAGCSTGPDHVAPEVEVPVSWRIDEGALRADANARWWSAIEDPVLDALVDEALRANRDVRVATARVEQFAARVGLTRAEAFPQVDYGAGASRSQVSRETATGPPPGTDRQSDLFSATLNVGWELDVWGRIARATEAARADLLQSAEARRGVILTLTSAVAASYVELRSLDAQLEIARETLRSRADVLEVFGKQYEGGVVSSLEISQLQAEYEVAAVAIPVLERRIAQLENSLSVLLGRAPGTIERGRTVTELVVPRPPEGLPADLLVRRPDLLAAEQRLAAANARIGEARAAFLPRVALTGTLGLASEDLGRIANRSATLWDVGAALAGPIFTGGALEANVEIAEATRREALEAYAGAILTALREVEDALVARATSDEELAARTRQVEALREAARLARIRYDNGYVSYIEVLDADRRLFDAELAEVSVVALRLGSLIELYKATGGGWIDRAAAVTDEQLAREAEAVEDGEPIDEAITVDRMATDESEPDEVRIRRGNPASGAPADVPVIPEAPGPPPAPAGATASPAPGPSTSANERPGDPADAEASPGG